MQIVRHSCLLLLGFVQASTCHSREPNDFEIGAFISSPPSAIEGLQFPLDVVVSDCKESPWGFEYKIIVAAEASVRTLQSTGYDAHAPTCDDHFIAFVQPAMVGSALFRIDPARAYPVPDVRKYWDSSFDVRAPRNTYFLGDYLFPPAKEIYVARFSDSAFSSFRASGSLRCDFLEMHLGPGFLEIGECESARFSVLYIARVGTKTIILGARR